MAVTSADTLATAGEAPPPSRRRVVAIAAVVAVAVPIVVLLVRALASHWITFSDWASIELRTSDVGTRHTPLLGPYSRYGWSHPGPLMYYALALPYRIVGSRAVGLLVGTLLVNTAALVSIAIVLWRRGRLTGLLTGGAVVLLLVRALPGDFLVNPWNPFIILFPILAVVACCWAATDGDARWALPVVIVIGSFAMQSHVGASAAVVVPIAFAIVYCIIDALRDGEFARFAKTLLIAFVVGIVCWIPPLINQFTAKDGNLSQLVRFWTQHHDHVTGWSEGARLVQPQLTLPAPWFTGHEALNYYSGSVDPGWHIPWALFLLIGAFVVAVRRGDRQSGRICVLALSLIVAAFVASSRIVDDPIQYIVKWLWVVGAVTWLAIAWTAMRAFAAAPDRRRRVTYAAGAIVVALVVASTIRSVNTQIVNPNNDQRSLRALARTARPALRALDQPVLIQAPPDLKSGTISAGILTLALHEGVDARFPTGWEYQVGSTHTIPPDDARSHLMVATDDVADGLFNDPSYRVVASYDPLTPAERKERAVIRYEFGVESAAGNAATADWVRAHKKDFDLLRSFDKRGPRIAVFERVNVNR